MSTAETIATLVAKLGFTVDYRGLIAFEKRLQKLQVQMAGISQKTTAAFTGTAAHQKAQQLQYAKGMALQQKAQRGEILTQRLSAQGFKAKLAESRLLYATAQQGHLLQQSRNRTTLQGIRLTEAQTRASVVAQRLEQARLRTSALQARMHKSEAAARLSSISASVRAATAGVGPAAIGGGFGAGIGGLLGGFTALQIGLGAVAGAAYLAVAGLKKFADNAVTEGEKGKALSYQFNALSTNPAVGKEAESRFYAKADDLGVNAQEVAPDYVKGMRSLVDAGMEVSKAESLVSGLLEYSKANNISSAKMSLALNAINQMASKNQVMSEEWKSQLAEQIMGAGKLGALAWAKVQGKTVNPDNTKQVQQATAQLTADIGDGAIKGEAMVAFFTALSAEMSKAANKGGLLDVAKQTHESNANRLANLDAQHARDAFNQNGGELSKGRQQLDVAMLEFTKSMGPLNSKLGEMSAGLLSLLAGVTDLTTAVMYWANKFFDSDEEKIKAPKTPEESKAYTDRLATLTLPDERDPTKRRPMGMLEQSTAYIKFQREQARLSGRPFTQADASREALN